MYIKMKNEKEVNLIFYKIQLIWLKEYFRLTNTHKVKHRQSSQE